MKNFFLFSSLTILFLLLFPNCKQGGNSYSSGSDFQTDSLIGLLDSAIAIRPNLIKQKEDEIEYLTDSLAKCNSDSLRYEIYSSIYKLSLKFNYRKLHESIDSMQIIAERLGDKNRKWESLIRIANVLSLENPGTEVTRTLSEIDPVKLPPQLRYDYYSVLSYNYSVLSMISGNKFKSEYQQLTALNFQKRREAANKIEGSSHFSELYLTYSRDNQENINNLNRFLKRRDISVSDPAYAMAAFRLHFSYLNNGDTLNATKSLVKSAISDILNCTKDHSSMYVLARVLYEKGDLKRAYSYVQLSVKDAIETNSRQMLFNATNSFVIIHSAFMAYERQKIQMMWIILFAIIGTAAGFIIATISIKRYSMKLEKALEELNKVNGKYKETVDELAITSNIKEKYLLQFLTLGSGYIESKETLKKKVMKLVRLGRTENIAGIVDINESTDPDLERFYELFDTTILEIFPGFTNKVNTLMLPEYQLKMKSHVELTLELRILALIALGINDSSLIAKYLRSSVTTIYTYRSKIRRHSIEPENFEENLSKIGKISIPK